MIIGLTLLNRLNKDSYFREKMAMNSCRICLWYMCAMHSCYICYMHVLSLLCAFFIYFRCITGTYMCVTNMLWCTWSVSMQHACNTYFFHMYLGHIDVEYVRNVLMSRTYVSHECYSMRTTCSYHTRMQHSYKSQNFSNRPPKFEGRDFQIIMSLFDIDIMLKNNLVNCFFDMRIFAKVICK